MIDTSIINIACVIIATFGIGGVFALLLGFFKRSGRPELALGRPIALAYGLRLLAVGGLSASGLGSTLRGGDELYFLANAHRIATAPFSSGLWLPGSPTRTQPIEHKLFELLPALQIKLLGFPEGALRVTQVGAALVGLILILIAVHDLAGPRAARLAAWIIAIEPANVFFNGLLHKEPMMELASGLVVLGATKVWRGLNPAGIVLMAAGSFVAVTTRPYVGWFLATASVVVIFHASIRHVGSLRSIPLVYGVVIAGLLAAPVILQATTTQNLKKQLQSSQNANTQVATAAPGAAVNENGNNLALEQVNYSTRTAILTSLPQRIRDILLRPYPWQIGDTGQRLALLGSIFALGALWLLIRYGWQARGAAFQRIGPLLYPVLFLTIAYALSVGNAGTGFRYRTHLVTLGLAMVVVLRAHLRGEVQATTPTKRGIVRPAWTPSVGFQNASKLGQAGPSAS